jgi:hypothetical protein
VIVVWILELGSEDDHDAVLEEVVKVYRIGVHTLGIEVVDPEQGLIIHPRE